MARLSNRVPTIVAFTLIAALVADWAGAPLWLPKYLAFCVGCLAFVVLAGRDRRQFQPSQDLESGSEKSWIDYELAGKGTPAGFYPLGFFSIVTIMLTGVQSPYSMPAWAAFALGIAWGIAKAHYPVGDEREPL